MIKGVRALTVKLSRGLRELAGRVDKPAINRFFKGKAYPTLVAIIVVLGHITALELYFNTVNMLLFCAALWLCESVRPSVVFACTFMFQLTRVNSPGTPNYSDYYFSGFRPWLLLTLAVLMVVSLVRFIIVNRIFSGFKITRAPLLPLALLSLAFVLAGAFSSGWVPGDLLHGFCQAVTYSFIFLVFYGGFRREKGSELVSYFTYFSAIMAVILLCEIAFLYAAGDVIQGGRIIKEQVQFGWGIWTTAGIYFAVLIPMCFLGVINEKQPIAYFLLATATLIGAVLTLSRNSILFGGAVYCLCVLICCFKGKNRRLFRIIAAIGALALIVGCIAFWDKIPVMLNSFFYDNGRYNLWRIGIDNFLRAPIFGNGYYSFDVTENVVITTTFLPKMAHQTFVQILSAMGVFGLMCYLFYRYHTLVPFLRRPTAVKVMLLLSVLVLLGGSMLDNFIFRFHHIFHYSATVAVALRLYDEEQMMLYGGEKNTN